MSTWENVSEDKIAIDPITGRFAFPKSIAPLLERMNIPSRERIFKQVRSTFYYGFSADMGGGEYHRAASFTGGLKQVKTVGARLKPIQDALDSLRSQDDEVSKIPEERIVKVIEIISSGRIEGSLSIQAALNQSIELRAADFRRPLLVLEGKTPELLISGENGSQVTLNGLVISHGTLRVVGNLEHLTLRHCTLVPGLALSEHRKPLEPSGISLIVESPYTQVEIDHCIVGSLRVVESAQVSITASIVDATKQSHTAYAGYHAPSAKGTAPEQKHKYPGAALSVKNCTIIGRVHTVAMEAASNTIFLAQTVEEIEPSAPLVVKRRQEGCIRCSYVPAHSHTPRRYKCVSAGEHEEHNTPAFTSLRYGEPGYCQLLQRSPVKAHIEENDSVKLLPNDYQAQQNMFEASIRQGADDEAEMGAFHDLFQPQRETNLRLRLAEYLSFTMEPSIVYRT
ncbi:MAG: hypothetical protein NVS4B7_16950 [Ktedonobacteraceae bacterium]